MSKKRKANSISVCASVTRNDHPVVNQITGILLDKQSISL